MEPSREEAAAMVAAIEQFLRDTARPAAAPAPAPSAWVRAARREAVGASELPWR